MVFLRTLEISGEPFLEFLRLNLKDLCFIENLISLNVGGTQYEYNALKAEGHKEALKGFRHFFNISNTGLSSYYEFMLANAIDERHLDGSFFF